MTQPQDVLEMTMSVDVPPVALPQELRVTPVDLSAFLSDGARALLANVIDHDVAQKRGLHGAYLARTTLREPRERELRAFADLVSQAVRSKRFVGSFNAPPLVLKMATGRRLILVYLWSSVPYEELKAQLPHAPLIEEGGSAVPLEPEPFPSDWIISDELVARLDALSAEDRARVQRERVEASIYFLLTAEGSPPTSSKTSPLFDWLVREAYTRVEKAGAQILAVVGQHLCAEAMLSSAIYYLLPVDATPVPPAPTFHRDEDGTYRAIDAAIPFPGDKLPRRSPLLTPPLLSR